MTKTPWTLRVTSGPDVGREFPILSDSTLIIGRGSDSDTRIRDPRISRVHCEVIHHGSEIRLSDRGGGSGTYVAGELVDDSLLLAAGDEFQLGDTRIRLERTGPLDASTIANACEVKHESNETAEPLTTKRLASIESQPSLSNLVGQKIHRFRMDSLISESVNSVVYKAFDTKRERVVAFKVLRPSLATTEVQQERFIRAMRTALPIRHPHIVRLYKAGRHGPHCWAAMQWIDGVSIRELIDNIGVSGMLDWKEVWRVAVHVGRALHEASKHRIVHRNITPSNMLRRNNDRNYLITDLIFARALEETGASQLTRPGDVIGELSFIAPERILDSTFQDPRSDQYSLGATLYALLTGERPYQAIGVADLIEKIRCGNPSPPNAFQRGIHEGFNDIVMKMLSTTPEQRFRTTDDLLRQLQRTGELGGIDADWNTWQ